MTTARNSREKRVDAIRERLMAEGEMIKKVEDLVKLGGKPHMIMETVKHTIERIAPPAGSVSGGMKTLPGKRKKNNDR